MISDQGNVGGLACSDLICPLGICKLKKGPGYNYGSKIKKTKTETLSTMKSITTYHY